MKIGSIDCGDTALAPMAGITDSPFRQICKSFGMTYCVSEMISTRGLCYGDKKTHTLLKFTEAERPIAIQLFGNDSAHFAESAEIITEKYRPDVIDINMGCPAPKIFNNGDGSALLNDPVRASNIIKATVAATPLPVTVKIRLGITDNSIGLDFAKMIEQSGAAAITVHGRNRAQMYRPGVDYDSIAKIKQSVSIPVIGKRRLEGRYHLEYYCER